MTHDNAELEALRERALSAEAKLRRSQAETVVHRMFAMKVAARKTDLAGLERDADTLLQTAPGSIADTLLEDLAKALAVVEAARECATVEQCSVPTHVALAAALAAFDDGGGE